MSDNRMNYSIDKQMQFPLVDIELEPGEKVFIQLEAWFIIQLVSS